MWVCSGSGESVLVIYSQFLTLAIQLVVMAISDAKYDFAEQMPERGRYRTVWFLSIGVFATLSVACAVMAHAGADWGAETTADYLFAVVALIIPLNSCIRFLLNVALKGKIELDENLLKSIHNRTPDQLSAPNFKFDYRRIQRLCFSVR